MRRFRQITSIITLLCMCFSISSTFAENLNNESNATLFFSSDDGIGKMTAPTYAVAETGREKVIEVKSGAKMSFGASEIKESDADIISFDFKVPDSGTVGYFELFDPEIIESESYYQKYKRVFYINKANMGAFSAYDGGGIAASSKRTTPVDKWTHVDICVNYKEKVIDVFVGGETNGTIALPDDYPLCGGMRFVLNSSTSEPACLLDNITMYHIEKAGKFFELPKGITYPSELNSYAEINSTTLGSIYFTQTPIFELEIENVNDNKTSYEISVDIYDDNEIFEYTNTTNVEVEGMTSTIIPLKVSTKYYGFHEMSITITDSVTQKPIALKKTFSTVMKNEIRNKKAGINDHTSMLHGIDRAEDKMRLFMNAGFDFFRTSYKWPQVETSKGKFAFINGMERQYNATVETGMGTYQTLVGHNSAVNGEPGFDKPSSIKNFGDYAAWVANLTKDLDVKFELWNEYNHTSFNEAGSTVEQYIQLENEVYSRVKAINPNAKIYTMGGVTRIANLYDWIEEYFTLGGGKNSDGFSFHPYTPSGTSETAYDVFKKVKEIIVKHGYGDKALSLSEMGWTKPVETEESQADYIAQFALLTYDEVDNYVWYVNQMKQGTSISENEFGWIRAWDEAYAAPFEPYSARPVFIAMAAQNKLMNGATNKEFIEVADSTIRITKYTLPNGQNIIGAWCTTNDKKNLNLSIDADTVDFYDPYGNVTKRTAIDGKYTFPITPTPIYIIGNFSNVKEADAATIAISKREVSTTINDTFSLYLTKNFEGDVKVEVEAPKNISVDKNDGFNGKTAEVKFAVGNSSIKGSAIRIKIIKDNMTVNEYVVPVKYINTVNAKVSASYFRSRRWQYDIKIKNNKTEKTVSGRVIMQSSAGNDEIEFKNIPAGSTRNIYVNIPEDLLDVKAPFDGKVVLEGGEEYPLKSDVYLSSIIYTTKKPNIDGVIDDKEWFKDAPFKLKYLSQVYMSATGGLWGGVKDVGGNAYAMYDKENFYISAEISDDVFGYTGVNAWQNDSLQFAFSPTNEKNAIRTEFGIGPGIDGKKIIERYSFVTVDTGILGVTDKGDLSGIKYEIKRDEENKKTYYEVQIPWEEIYGPGFNVTRNDSLYFAMLVNDNDGEARRGWIEFCPGIGKQKDPSLFKDVPLAKRSRIEW